MLAKLAQLIAAALLKAAIDWLKDPANRDDIEAVVKAVTDATPWKWDNKAVDLAALPTQIVNEIIRRVPFLGGR